MDKRLRGKKKRRKRDRQFKARREKSSGVRGKKGERAVA